MQSRIYFIPIILFLVTRVLFAEKEVDQFGFFETAFIATGDYTNPFTDLEARAEITIPDGSTRRLALFWDGGRTWKLRISPDVPGVWTFIVRSVDKGLDGQAGSFSCTASLRRGSIVPMKEHGLHLTTQDGIPFLFWGDTAWGLYLDQESENLNRQSVFRYIDKRAAEGINIVHSMLLSEAGWGNKGGDPFFDITKMEINPAYWQEVDVRLAYLNKKGIIGGLVIAWGDKQRREPWAWRMFPDIDARERYARYIAARYGAYDVYFILAGEWNAEARTRENTTRATVKQEFFELGGTFAQADAHNRMLGIHPMTRDGSVREFHEAGWMSFGDYQQNYPDVHNRLLLSRKFNKPIVNSEYGYFLRDASGDGKVDKHNSFTPEDMRFVTWDIIMAGAYPVTGYGTTYMGGYRDPGPFNPDDSRNDAWARQYHLAQHFLTGLNWWKMAPMDKAITCRVPRGEDREVEVRMGPTRTRKVRRPPLTAYWLLAEPGRHYVAYVRGVDDSVTIQLDENDREQYRVRLFNPRTGAMRGLPGKSRQNNFYTFAVPDRKDWVVHLVNRNSPAWYKAYDKRPAAKTAGWTVPALEQAAVIPLLSGEKTAIERLRLVRGGEYTVNGWQVKDKLDRLIIELIAGFAWNEAGAIELDMTNLDFDAQVNGKKQHYFNFYADPTGDPFNLHNAFFTLRAGNYKNDKGERGIKVLWRGGKARGEKAPFAARAEWDPQKVYTWRAEWDQDKFLVLLDGEKIFGPADFSQRDRARPLRYLFLSRDGALQEDVWFGFPGPVYKEIRIYREVR